MRKATLNLRNRELTTICVSPKDTKDVSWCGKIQQLSCGFDDEEIKSQQWKHLKFDGVKWEFPFMLHPRVDS